MPSLRTLLYKPARVFLSYASEYKALAEQIALSLRGHGFKVFYDRDDLPPGASYDDKILRAIEASSAFVFLLSPQALQDGRYTLTELHLARRRWPNPSRAVLPVMAAPVAMARIPDYLKAVTILEPQGNLPAEVSAAVGRLGRRLRLGAIAAVAAASLLLIAGGALLYVRAQGSIDLAVTLQQNDNGKAAPSSPMAVTYAVTENAGVSHITYRLPYQDLVRSGGPVHGIDSLQRPFVWGFPSLSVKLANNTPRNVVLTRAVVTISASDVDAEPLILFQDSSLDALAIVNEGWGEVIDPTLEFSVKAVGEVGDVDLFAPAVEKVSRKTFSTSDSFALSPFVPERLRSADTVVVSGTLTYGPAGGRKTLAFETKVLLDIKAAQALPPSFSYPPAFFPAGKPPAVLSIPLSQSIKAGEADNFLLTLGTDKTSRNSLSVAFETATGKVLPGGTVQLDLFVPRTKGGAATEAGR